MQPTLSLRVFIMEEVWKDIVWFDYQVSSIGGIRNSKWLLRKLWHDGNGYYCIRLHNRKTFKIHTLVAKYFIWDKPEGHVINHKDWDKHNNNVSNLEYCSYSDNNKHAYALWLNKWILGYKFDYKERPSRQKSLVQKTLDWHILRVYDSGKQANKVTGISRANISSCINWKLKSAWWYIRCFESKVLTTKGLKQCHVNSPLLLP